MNYIYFEFLIIVMNFCSPNIYTEVTNLIFVEICNQMFAMNGNIIISKWNVGLVNGIF